MNYEMHERDTVIEKITIVSMPIIVMLMYQPSLSQHSIEHFQSFSLLICAFLLSHSVHNNPNIIEFIERMEVPTLAMYFTLAGFGMFFSLQYQHQQFEYLLLIMMFPLVYTSRSVIVRIASLLVACAMLFNDDNVYNLASYTVTFPLMMLAILIIAINVIFSTLGTFKPTWTPPKFIYFLLDKTVWASFLFFFWHTLNAVNSAIIEYRDTFPLHL